MRAVLLSQAGASEVSDLPDPVPSPGSVTVDAGDGATIQLVIRWEAVPKEALA
jgi:hypothetical protein